MKSLPMSVGKKFLWASLVVVFGCAEAPNTTNAASSASTSPSTSGSKETSLSDDQKQIEEMRKSIPEDRRKHNDELKTVLDLFGQVGQPPETIRDKYQRIISRSQDEFRRKAQKQREEFDRIERKNRDSFMAGLKKDREEFDKKKHDAAERKDFYDDQDARRRSFNASEREKRDDFNTTARQQNDDFRTESHDQEIEFTTQYRAYVQKYNDMKKAADEKRHPSRPSPIPAGTVPHDSAFGSTYEDEPADAPAASAPTMPAGDAAAVNSMFNGSRETKAGGK